MGTTPVEVLEQDYVERLSGVRLARNGVPPTVFPDTAPAGALFLDSTLPLTMLFSMMAAGLV